MLQNASSKNSSFEDVLFTSKTYVRTPYEIIVMMIIIIIMIIIDRI